MYRKKQNRLAAALFLGHVLTAASLCPAQDKFDSYSLDTGHADLLGAGDGGKSLYVADYRNQQLLHIDRDSGEVRPGNGTLHISVLTARPNTMLSADGRYSFIHGSEGGLPLTAICQDLETGEQVFKIPDYRPIGSIGNPGRDSIRFASDSTFLILPRVQDSTTRLALWNLVDRRWEKNLPGGFPWCIHPDSRSVAVAHFAPISLQDQRLQPYLQMIDLESREEIWTSDYVLELPEGGRWARPKLDACFSRDGDQIAIASNSTSIAYPTYTGTLPSQLSIVESKTGEVVRRIELDRFPQTIFAPQITFGRFGKSVLVTSGISTQNGTATLVDIATDPPRIVASGQVAALSEDAAYVCFIEKIDEEPLRVRILSLNDHSQTAEIELADAGNVFGVALAPKGNHVALWCNKPVVGKIWNWTIHVLSGAGTEPSFALPLPLDNFEIGDMAFLPGNELVAGYQDGTRYIIRVNDPDSGR